MPDPVDIDEDLDPAAAPDDLAEGPGSGIAASNFGRDGRGDLSTEEGPEPSLGSPAVVAFDIARAEAFLDACMTSVPRVGYKLGAKVQSGEEPGKGLRAVDCSGFVREVMRRATNLGPRFPDGSVIQHDWIRARGFAPASFLNADAVYIAFLSPNDSPSKIGHVVLIHDGKTLESHGGVGPDARPWTRKGWQAKARVYVLDPSG